MHRTKVITSEERVPLLNFSSTWRRDVVELPIRFRREAKVVAALNHPSIVHIYEFGEEEGSYFLAMEWVDGVALGKIIRRSRQAGGIPAPVAVKVSGTDAPEASEVTVHTRVGAPESS